MISYFQIMSLIFIDFADKPRNLSSDRENAAYFIIDRILNKFNLFGIFNTYPSIHLALQILCLIFLSFLSLLFYQVYSLLKSKENEKSIFHINLLANILYIYDSILMLPIHMILIANFDKATYQPVLGSVSTLYYLSIAIDSILVAVNISFGMFSSFFFWTPVENRDPLARISGFNSRACFFYKIIMGTIYIYEYGALIDVVEIRTVVNILFILTLAANNMLHPPYYMTTVSKGLFYILSVCLIYSIVLGLKLIQIHNNEDEYSWTIVLMIMLCPLIMKMSQTFLEYRLDSILYKGTGNSFFPQEILIRHAEFRKLLFIPSIRSEGENTDYTKEKEMKLMGFITRHLYHCKDGDCICKNRTSLYDPNTEEFSNESRLFYRDQPFLLHFSKRILKKGFQKFSSSTNLLVLQAYYLASSLKFVHQAYILLENSKRYENTSISTKLSCLWAHKEIEKNIRHKYDENNKVYGTKDEDTQNKKIDSRITLTFEDLSNRLLHLITNGINLSTEFWYEVKKHEIQLSTVDKKLRKLRKINHEIEEVWKEISPIKHKSQTRNYLLYGIYLQEVNNNHMKAEEIMRESVSMQVTFLENKNKKLEGISTETLFAPDMVCVLASGQRNNLGTIYDATQAITTVFGRTPSEVKGGNLDLLMTGIFAKDHGPYMMGYLEKGKEVVLNRLRLIFGMHSAGHIFPINIYVKMNPDISLGISYLGLMKPIQSFDYYMITNASGVIDSASRNLLQELGCTATLFQHDKIRITHLCPELENVLKAMNYKAYKTYGKQVLKLEKEEKLESFLGVTSPYLSKYREPENEYTSANFFDGLTQSDIENFTKLEHDFTNPSGTEIRMVIPSSMHIRDLKLNMSQGPFESSESQYIKALGGNPVRTRVFKSENGKTLRLSCVITDIVFKERDIVRLFTMKPLLFQAHSKLSNSKTSADIEKSPASWKNLKKTIKMNEQFFLNQNRKAFKDITKKIDSKYNSPRGRDKSISFGHKESSISKSIRKQSEPFPSQSTLPIIITATFKTQDLVEPPGNEFGDVALEGNPKFSSVGMDYLPPVPDANRLKDPEDTYYPPVIVLDDFYDEVQGRHSYTSPDFKINPQKNHEIFKIEVSDGQKIFTEGSFNKVQQKTPTILNLDKDCYAYGTKETISKSKKEFSKFMTGKNSEKTNLSNEFHAQKAILHVFAEENASSEDTSNFASFIKAYSKAIQEKYYSPSYLILTKVMNTMLIIIYLLALGLYVYNETSIQDVGSLLSLLQTSASRNQLINDLFRRVRNADLLSKGLIYSDRYAKYGVLDYFDFNFAKMISNSEDTKNKTALLYNQLNLLSKDSIAQLHTEDIVISELDPLTGFEMNNSVDTFAISFQIVGITQKIAYYSLEDIKKNKYYIQSDMNYVIENSADHLINKFQEFQKSLIDSILYDQNKFQQNHTAIVLVLEAVVISIFIIFNFLIKNLNHEKEYNYKLLTEIQDKEIMSILKFLNALKDIINHPKHSPDDIITQYHTKKAEASEASVSLARSLSMKKKINKSDLTKSRKKYILGLFVVVAIPVSYFAIELADFTLFLSDNKDLINQISKTNDYYLAQSYGLTAIREVILTNSTFIMGQERVDLFFEQVLAYLSKLWDFSDSYLNKDFTLDPQINDIIFENLCPLVVIDYQTNCLTVLQGGMTKGLLNFNTDMAKYLSIVYDTYLSRRGNYSFSADIINDERFIELEYTFLLMIQSCYSSLTTYLLSKFDDINATQKDFVLRIFLIFLLVQTIGVCMIWLKIVKRLKGHEERQKDIFKLIPYGVTLQNRKLKSHLIKTSKETFKLFKF